MSDSTTHRYLRAVNNQISKVGYDLVSEARGGVNGGSDTLLAAANSSYTIYLGHVQCTDMSHIGMLIDS